MEPETLVITSTVWLACMRILSKLNDEIAADQSTRLLQQAFAPQSFVSASGALRVEAILGFRRIESTN